MPYLAPGQPVHAWLRGPAALYGLAVSARDWCYRRGWLTAVRVPCRVVSVGNLTVGGTGKTPVVMLLTEWLQADGQQVAVLSRGYKRRGMEDFLLVSDGKRLLAAADQSGDEPFLIARRCPKAVVAVGSDRAALARWVLKQFPVDCLVLDDGFQHRSLARDVDVVLLDATDATGLDALLPAGRLREPLSGLTRASAVAVTRAESPGKVEAVRRRVQSIPVSRDLMEVVFRPESLVSVATSETRRLAECRGQRAWLVSGIGHTDAFRRSAGSVGLHVVGETAFRDHHLYRAEEVSRIRAEARAAGADVVLTTEKDAGKLVPLLGADQMWWALRVCAEVVQGSERLRRMVIGERREGRSTGK